MSEKSDNPSIKPVLVRLTPQMSREEQVQNLIAALKKSGFTVKPGKQKDEGDAS
jgi:hypothetical protein